MVCRCTGVSSNGCVVTTVRVSTGSRVITVVCALALPTPASTAVAIAAWRKYVIGSSWLFRLRGKETRAAPMRSRNEVPRLAHLGSQCVRRFVEQFEFGAERGDAQFRFGPGQNLFESVEFIGVDRKLFEARRLFGRHRQSGGGRPFRRFDTAFRGHAPTQ